MVSHDLAKFGGHRHCCSRSVMFLVVEKQDPTCFFLNLLLLFMSKGHGFKAHSILW